MKTKRIAFIGNFGLKSSSLDGQTIKTQMIYNYLKYEAKWKIFLVNTENNKGTKKIALFFKSFFALLFYKKIFLIVARNGINFYLPKIYFFKKIRRLEVYNSGIGAKHDEFIRRNSKFIKYFNSCKINMFETEGECRKMEVLGVKNCVRVGNFKQLFPLSRKEVSLPNNESYKFCTFSRLSVKKGIIDAVEAIHKYNNKNQQKIYLDLYGTIDDDFMSDFSKLNLNDDAFVNYCGSVAPSESVNVLKKYDALIFPTKHKTEGFPGTILDAYASGLPIIASDVCYNKEFVNEKNGVLYSSPSSETLLEAIEKFISRKNEHLDMRINSLMRYDEFDYFKIGNKIDSIIRGEYEIKNC